MVLEPVRDASSAELPVSTKGKTAAMIAVICVLTLAVAEAMVRIVLPHPAHFLGHPAAVPGLVTEHEIRGYTWTANFVGTMTSADYVTEYSISEQGLRDAPVADGSAERILVVGDSFTAGEGTEATEAWPKQLELILNGTQTDANTVRVINAAVTGYGARQMRQMAEEYVPRFEPNHVMIGVYTSGYNRVEDPFTLVGMHLVRSEYASKMRVLDDGRIWWHQTGFESPVGQAVEVFAQNHWHFGAYLMKAGHRVRGLIGSYFTEPPAARPAQARLQPVFNELLLLSRYLADRDIELTVLAICGQGRDGDFIADNKVLARALRAFGESNSIRIVDPTEAFEEAASGAPVFRFPNDGHWTAAAHRIAAKELADSMLGEVR